MIPMKSLVILRHAKSSWDSAHLTDFQRPLNERGVHDAPRIGKALRERGIKPDLILSSPAERAKQTVEAVVKAAHLPLIPQFVDTIYGASLQELLTIIRGLPDTTDCVLMVGHNPGFEELVSLLTGTERHMSTAALAHIVFEEGDWENIGHKPGELAWFVVPKQLEEQEGR